MLEHNKSIIPKMDAPMPNEGGLAAADVWELCEGGVEEVTVLK